MVGPAIASGLYVLLGVTSLLADAFSFLFSASCIRAMRPAGGGAGRHEPMWHRLKHGIRFAFEQYFGHVLEFAGSAAGHHRHSH